MNTNKKKTKRSDGIKVTGIAIDEDVLKQVAEVAKYQYRSRNNMIEVMLREQVAKYKAERGGK